MAGVKLKKTVIYDKDPYDKFMQRPGYETKTWDASSLTSYIIQGLRITCHLWITTIAATHAKTYMRKRPAAARATDYYCHDLRWTQSRSLLPDDI